MLCGICQEQPKVIGITDGDTITVRISKTIKIRLESIDAPEQR